MTDKRTFILGAHTDARRRALDCVSVAPDGLAVVVREPNRSLEQNAAQWPYLLGFSEQLLWPVNGALVKMTDDEWKDVLSAAFQREAVRIAQGLDGGVVMLGMRTSQMGKHRFSEWLEFLIAEATLRGVTPVYKHINRE